MSNWPSLFQKPEDMGDIAAVEAWFQRIARKLLNGCRLWVGREPHRFVEIEFYYCGPGHLDPFTHQDPTQLQTGRWYFHRTRGVYRGGSFKGMDLSFGDGTAHAGVLIRSIEKPDGTLVNGPSLLVDHLLDATGASGVAELDRTINARLAWDESNPLRLEETEDAGRTLYRTARVGLSLKRLRHAPDPPRFIMRPYRYLSEPKRIAKGKAHLVLALHAQGMDQGEIVAVTGCPKGSVKRYVEDFEAGAVEADVGPFWGIDFSTADLCKLAGVCHVKWGQMTPGKVRNE
jgi:3-methyladenine DNA glycosylase Mpg